MPRRTRTFASFIEKTGIPFIPMSMAKGLLADNHSQSAAAARSLRARRGRPCDADRRAAELASRTWQRPQWSSTTQFVQVDIMPTEMDSNRPIAAPVVGDIGSSMAALLAALKPGRIKPNAKWLEAIAERKQHNRAHGDPPRGQS